MFAAPQTPDGWITRVDAEGEGRYRAQVVFPIAPGLRDAIRGRERELVFAARSRLARLGINVTPASPLVVDGSEVGMDAVLQTTVRAYGVDALLGDVVCPGMRVGRLVFCPKEHRLSSTQVDELVQSHHLQLPRSYSIDDDGRFRIRPQGWIYDLEPELTVPLLRTILMQDGGKDVLNRIQVRRPVRRIALEPNDGVITSCSMFIHRHYVVLESMATSLGQHLEAVVLDPITTRGMDVFLEFFNRSSERIVNPTVAAAVYEAPAVEQRPRVWQGADFATNEVPTTPSESDDERSYTPLAKLFDRLEAPCEAARYSHRMAAIVEDMPAVLAGAEPRLVWRRPREEVSPASGADLTARAEEGMVAPPRDAEFGTHLLADVPAGAGATLLLGTFPNLIEHTQICAAALEGKLARLIFRRASFEHGSFFSARDHGRLADYEGLGLEVFWCQDERRHVAQHIFRGLRGFFTRARDVERFRSALIFAAYGSAKPLPVDQVERMKRLILNLREFFGPDIAFMTGGGPGAMQQVTDLGQSMGLLVGASFIETVDQETNKSADFYQTFQGRARASRQRWFEIASFHLFFMGGVGTLEEVGITLTDMKLGVIERSPLVFFGRHEGRRYWRHQIKQFKEMVAAGRAPAWLRTNILMTDEPDDVLPFYQRILELG